MMSINRRYIIGAGFVILSILIMIILRYDTEIYDIKKDMTKIAFLLIFPQLFAGYSIHQAKFISFFNFFRTNHRVFGYVLVGIYIIVASFCIFTNVPLLKDFLNLTINFHMIFGILGFGILSLKLYSVEKSPYTKQTAILGTIMAVIFTGLFITGVYYF